jgi:hypothetical protein
MGNFKKPLTGFCSGKMDRLPLGVQRAGTQWRRAGTGVGGGLQGLGGVLRAGFRGVAMLGRGEMPTNKASDVRGWWAV